MTKKRLVHLSKEENEKVSDTHMLLNQLSTLNENYVRLNASNMVLTEKVQAIQKTVDLHTDDISHMRENDNNILRLLTKMETEVLGTKTIPSLREEISANYKAISNWKTANKILAIILTFILLSIGAFYRDIAKAIFGRAIPSKEITIPADGELPIE